MMVNRYDFLGTTQSFEKTAQGFLRTKAPVTDLHPSETGGEPFVSPQNAKKLAIGFAEDVRQDGDFIAGTLLISDAAVIAAVEAGERYDAIQKNIVINHVALGPSGWGRAGPQCSIKG